MRTSCTFGRIFLAYISGFGLAASAVDASSGVDRLEGLRMPELLDAQCGDTGAELALCLSASQPEGAHAANFDSTGFVELASNEYEDDGQPLRRSGPAREEVRGHENEVTVTRRSATPIPQVTNSKPRRRNKQARPGYNSSYYGAGGYGGHSYYYGGHVHHSHCGHHGYGYGDHFDSRTLGRSCMYGPKGKVIYKPADVICAPEDEEEPAAQPQPQPRPSTVQQPTGVRTQPQVKTDSPRPGKRAPAKRRAPVQPVR